MAKTKVQNQLVGPGAATKLQHSGPQTMEEVDTFINLGGTPVLLQSMRHGDPAKDPHGLLLLLCLSQQHMAMGKNWALNQSHASTMLASCQLRWSDCVTNINVPYHAGIPNIGDLIRHHRLGLFGRVARLRPDVPDHHALRSSLEIGSGTKAILRGLTTWGDAHAQSGLVLLMDHRRTR
ncbi:unnamed protein product [Lampetra planeri]